ncbi:hypothetical protein A3K24_03070 [candidate division Kazan bacterium RIFCSPHIGHO2_01_FULL_44_14]|uniref:BIG2 domain-containing protein n=1 Tax=candidate division Kazan bacterium RIFCSPLOWO2_01_FULL_45_19 TaxID=1798538 RepID=A0A1F4NQN7_UNCK3|nr:hypothetical protein [uncultured bacterium]OGB73783.1 MAG: hypothetical protein A3K51_03070 [candidate division Kazan bacterium RIFCSPLOWO2_01_FULL_45_19]OGB78028.1 MAG: hypothetical protein A3K24_03070 [candidate division Kazan bacterium RIFCSPHIGHO2_01_FULL_44_14]
MKKSTVFHKFWGLVEKELEASLAVLVVLGAIFGYSLASTELVAGDIQIAGTTTSFSINSRIYSGINFTNQNLSGQYRVRATSANTTPGNVSQGLNGIVGQTSGANYTFVQPLTEPFTGVVYVQGGYDRVTIGDTSVSTPQGAIALNSVDVIVMTFAGGSTIKSITLTPGSSSGDTVKPITPPVSTLYVLPSIASLTVGQTRDFSAVALDATGNSISDLQITWSFADEISKERATINSATGELTGVQAGTVKVKATANGASATATITVRETVATVPSKIVNIPSTDTTTDKYLGAEESATYPGASEGNTALDTVADALTAPSTDGSVTETKTMVATALDAFAVAQTKQITETGSTLVSQTAVNQIIAETATTTTQKLAMRVSLNWEQFKRDIQAMFSPASETNVVKTVANFISQLIIGNKGTDASTGVMGEGFGEDKNL